MRAAHDREVYEQITRRRVDPALVEEITPNTFEARVFPIQTNDFHRVIVSYEQTLPRVDNEVEYMFPIPEGEHSTLNFELRASAATMNAMHYTGDFRGQTVSNPDNHTFGVHVENNRQDKRASFQLHPHDATIEIKTIINTDPARQKHHFALHLQKNDTLNSANTTNSANTIFLLNTSLSETPEHFNIDVALLRTILEHSPNIRRFNVITFDTNTRWLVPQ